MLFLSPFHAFFPWFVQFFMLLGEFQFHKPLHGQIDNAGMDIVDIPREVIFPPLSMRGKSGGSLSCWGIEASVALPP